MNERAPLTHEGLEGAVGIGDEAAVERIATLDGLQLDELGSSAGARLRHGGQLADGRDGSALARETRHHRRRAWRERLRGADLEVRAQQRFRRARDGHARGCPAKLCTATRAATPTVMQSRK